MSEVDEQMAEQAVDQEQTVEQAPTAQRELEQLRAENARLVEQVDAVERRRRIDQLLLEAEAIDLDAARLLTEHAIEQMDDADVADVVTDLREHKPWLFRRDTGRSGSMSPRVPATDETTDAAEAAMRSGHRRDLLRYLRARRKRRG